jgi:hypothetical protein
MRTTCSIARSLARYLAPLAGKVLAAALLAIPAAAQTTGTNGNFRTLGGTGEPGFQDGIQGFSAFRSPSGVAERGDGFIYIADSGNNAIRRLRLSDRIVEAYTTSNISVPVAIAFDSATNMFVVNQGNSSITRYDAFGNYREILRPAFTGGQLTALAIDAADNLYVAQVNGVVTAISPTGFITGTYRAPADGRVHHFRGVAVADDGSVFVSDAAQHVIWRFSAPDQSPELFAGDLGFAGKLQGERGIGQLNQPHHIAIGPENSIVVADRGNHQIRGVSCEGTITILAGIDPARWFVFESPEVFPGWWDSTAEFAELREPVGVTVDAAGTVYDTEVYYHLVRRGGGLNFPDCGITPPTDVPLTPVLSPNSGIFTNTATVRVTSASGVPFAAGTQIYYTMDGSDPGPGNPQARLASFAGGEGIIVLSGQSIDLGNLKVRVFFNGDFGPIVSGLPTSFDPVAVQLSPNQGFFPNGVEVRVTSASPEGFGPRVQIYYTTDRTDPTQQSASVPIVDGIATINLTGAVDLSNLRVRAFNNGVAGPVASGLAPVLPRPGLNPPSGYFLTNVVITVTNSNDPSGLFPAGTRLFYTTDGSTPTQSSTEAVLNGGIAIISLQGPINLENLSVRAFLGNTPGTVVTGEPTSDLPNRITFGFARPEEASSDFIAMPGQTFSVPVTLTLRPGQLMYGLQFSLVIDNVTGPAAPNYQVGFTSMLRKPSKLEPGTYEGIPPATFSFRQLQYVPTEFGTNIVVLTNATSEFQSLLFTNVAENLLGVGWLERAGKTNLYDTLSQDLIRFSQAHDKLFLSPAGKVVLGSYAIVLPTNAPAGSTYRVNILRPSANANGVNEDVFIETPNDPSLEVNAVETITVGERRYTVGDLAPFYWFNAGDFGDGSILNNDLEQIHQSVIYGLNRPPRRSDFEGAIDSCCVDTNRVDRSFDFHPAEGNDTVINQIGYGDGALNIADLYVTYRRALDPSLVWYERYWSNGVINAHVIPNTFRGQTTLPGLSASSFRNELPPDDSGKLSSLSTEQPAVKLTAGGIYGSPGQVVEVPIYGNVSGSYPIRTLLLNLKVQTVDGRADITESVQFEPHPLLGAPQFGDGGSADGYAAAWIDPNHSGLSGNFLLGTLYVPIPPNATASSAYKIHFESVSASPNGVGILPLETKDGLIIMANRPSIGWNDGIPDAWRVQYFGVLTDLSSAGDSDADGDGVTNRQEFNLGSNPKDSDDHLSVRAGINTDRSVKLRFPTMAGRKYQLEVSNTLTPGSWTTVQSDILGTGSEIELSSGSGAAAGFYRVRVQQ